MTNKPPDEPANSTLPDKTASILQLGHVLELGKSRAVKTPTQLLNADCVQMTVEVSAEELNAHVDSQIKYLTRDLQSNSFEAEDN